MSVNQTICNVIYIVIIITQSIIDHLFMKKREY